VPEGLTFITFHFTESPGNILTNSASDPVTQTPEFKVCSVKVKKLDFSDFGCQKRKIFRKKSKYEAV
jgi:formate dehydrogenase major subunit